MNNVEKYGRTGQATDDNMARTLCMPDNQGYKNIPRIFNTCYFSTAAVVT